MIRQISSEKERGSAQRNHRRKWQQQKKYKWFLFVSFFSQHHHLHFWTPFLKQGVAPGFLLSLSFFHSRIIFYIALLYYYYTNTYRYRYTHTWRRTKDKILSSSETRCPTMTEERIINWWRSEEISDNKWSTGTRPPFFLYIFRVFKNVYSALFFAPFYWWTKRGELIFEKKNNSVWIKTKSITKQWMSSWRGRKNMI